MIFTDPYGPCSRWAEPHLRRVLRYGLAARPDPVRHPSRRRLPAGREVLSLTLGLFGRVAAVGLDRGQRLDLLGRVRSRLDRVLDLVALIAQADVRRGIGEVGLRLLLALGLALAGLGQRAVGLVDGHAGLRAGVLADRAADVGRLRGGGGFLGRLVDGGWLERWWRGHRRGGVLHRPAHVVVGDRRRGLRRRRRGRGLVGAAGSSAATFWRLASRTAPVATAAPPISSALAPGRRLRRGCTPGSLAANVSRAKARATSASMALRAGLASLDMPKTYP